MKLIVGLGNPGEKYEKTRHNIGCMVVEQFLKDFEPVKQTLWTFEDRFKSDIVLLEWQPKHGALEKVILAKPKTYMNNSGLAVNLLATYYKIRSYDIWVVHDDIDLPLGKMRMRLGGSSAGQKGIDSIINTLKTDRFWRFRMGIGHRNSEFRIRSSESKVKKLKNVEDFVLGSFKGAEWGKARKLIKRGAEALSTSLEFGLEVAQNKFN